MIESYKQRLIAQANGMKNSPFIDMCLASYKHGINETLDTLNLSNVEGTLKNWKEPVSKEIGDYDHKAVMESLHSELKEEPVSEDLGEYINELSKQFPEVSFAKLSRIAVRVVKWKEQQLMANAVDGVVHLFEKCKVASVHYNDPTGVPMAYFTSP
jgi:hypothetical protein